MHWKNEWGGEMLFSDMEVKPLFMRYTNIRAGLEIIPITHFSRQFQIPWVISLHLKSKSMTKYMLL